MNRKLIKHTDLEIAPINFGGNVFGWTLDEKQSFDVLDKFVGHGFNFVDTADTYAWWVNGKGGQSETIIGNWMKSRSNRKDIVLATKVGSETKEHGFDISKNHILKSVDESLQRLQTDFIDIYYTHFDDEKTSVEETLSAYDEIIKSGKVRYIAASNVSPARLKESFEVAAKNNLPKYVALQPHYNLVERKKFETEYSSLVEQFDLSVFPYWSLASGFLTGKYRNEADFSKSQRGGGSAKYLNDKGLAVVNVLDKIATNYNTQPAAIALAWLLNNSLITAPIVSATNENQMKAFIDAANIHLTDEEVKELNSISQF